MWWKKQPADVVDATEAHEARVAAERDLAQVKARGADIRAFTSALIERRAWDPFGADLQTTFRPRGTL